MLDFIWNALEKLRRLKESRKENKEKRKRVITVEIVEKYRDCLIREEKAPNTVKKYIQDVGKLMEYAGGRVITKELMIDYKLYLQKADYKASSINSFLTVANRFFSYMGWQGLDVRLLPVQPQAYRPASRKLSESEYHRLVDAARRLGRIRICMIITTICSMGLRVSELAAVTVAGVRAGVVVVNNKGKIRKVPVPCRIRELLLDYASNAGIGEGIIFRTKSGKPVSRSNVWRDMKKLCAEAGVDAYKVFPHNLRHLFAQTYYEKWKDIAKLADILGHSSIETTRIYLRSGCDECRREMDKLGLAEWAA